GRVAARAELHDRRNLLGGASEGDRVRGMRGMVGLVSAVLSANCRRGGEPIAEELAQRGEQRLVERFATKGECWHGLDCNEKPNICPALLPATRCGNENAPEGFMPVIGMSFLTNYLYIAIVSNYGVVSRCLHHRQSSPLAAVRTGRRPSERSRRFIRTK